MCRAIRRRRITPIWIFDMPKVRGILETALYVEDVGRAAAFYRRLLGFSPMLESERLTALDAGDHGVLLLFRRGATSDDLPTPTGTIPGHEGAGRLHLAFAIEAADYEPWKARLAEEAVVLTSEVTWSAGGRSLYFDDPDGNVVELATPGLWANW
jgi:catechol 2,3-dioxygenase-like lactoylglutathione lyase family enzyme